MNEYPRDMVGYGQKRPQLTWPDGSKIAVQFVLNYEEGGNRRWWKQKMMETEDDGNRR